MNNNFPYSKFLKSSKETAKSVSSASIKKNISNVQTPTTDDSSAFSAEELKKINIGIHSILINAIPKQRYLTLFEHNLQLCSLNNKTARFSVRTQYVSDIIKESYIPLLQKTLQEILGNDYSIELVISNESRSLSSNDNNILHSLINSNLSKNSNESDSTQKTKKVSEYTFSLDLNSSTNTAKEKASSEYINHIQNQSTNSFVDPTKTLANFIVGPNNRLAHATAKSIAKTPGKKGKYPCVYFVSGSGLGKTHLLHAITNEIKNENPSLACLFVSARILMNDLVDSIFKSKNIGDFQKKYSGIDVLIIDDIQEVRNKDRTQEEFFHIFNNLNQDGKQLILASDQLPGDIEGLDERLKTRMQWGLIVDIKPPEYETRIAIIKAKAKELDLYLADDVVYFLANCFKNSVRELEGALYKIKVFYELEQIEIDTEIAKELFAINIKNVSSHSIDIERVAKECAQFFHITVSDLKSKSRSKEIAKARHFAMYMSRKLLNATFEDIASFFGGRDHTSVIYAVGKVEDAIETSPSMKKDYDVIKTAIYK